MTDAERCAEAMDFLDDLHVDWFSSRDEACSRLTEILESRDARFAKIEAALREIASCESRFPGDVIDIAKEAIK